tara:strand:- start:1025 stop:1273 length:249 start_codon:yes stop_codon:yes gene_type:complete
MILKNIIEKNLINPDKNIAITPKIVTLAKFSSKKFKNFIGSSSIELSEIYLITGYIKARVVNSANAHNNIVKIELKKSNLDF